VPCTQVQGNELLIYNNSGSTPPSKAHQPPPEMRSKARVMNSAKAVRSDYEKAKDIPVTDLCSVSVPDTNTVGFLNGISASYGVLNCGQVTLAAGDHDMAYSLTSFGTVFQIDLTTGRTKQLLDSICSPGGSTGSLIMRELLGRTNPSFGPPDYLPGCAGFTGLAATHLGGSITKLFVSLDAFGGASSADPAFNSGGPQRHVVEIVVNTSSSNSSLLLLNSSIPYKLYPSRFTYAASFLASTLVQRNLFQLKVMQPGKYLAGSRVRLSAGHGKLFVGPTEGSLSLPLSFILSRSLHVSFLSQDFSERTRLQGSRGTSWIQPVRSSTALL
jgi:hypothetical protein